MYVRVRTYAPLSPAGGGTGSHLAPAWLFAWTGLVLVGAVVPSPIPPAMTLSCLFITDLQGKSIISRNYRGDVGVTQSIDTFQRYLSEVDDEAKTPVFHVDVHGDVAPDPESVGSAGEMLLLVGI